GRSSRAGGRPIVWDLRLVNKRRPPQNSIPRLLQPVGRRRGGRRLLEQYADFRQRKVIAAAAETAGDLGLAGLPGGGPGLGLAQRLEHGRDPLTRAGAAEGQLLLRQQLRGLLVEQAVQQDRPGGGGQLGRGEGVEQGAGPGPAVV